jgi:hypothetical protein
MFSLLICRYVTCDHCDGEGRTYAANDSVFGPCMVAITDHGKMR